MTKGKRSRFDEAPLVEFERFNEVRRALLDRLIREPVRRHDREFQAEIRSPFEDLDSGQSHTQPTPCSGIVSVLSAGVEGCSGDFWDRPQNSTPQISQIPLRGH